MSSPRRSLFVGTFVHCKGLQELDICLRGAIGVDEQGKIAFIERDIDDIKTITQAHGWEGSDITTARSSQFFFPGFVGKQSLQTHVRKCVQLDSIRYTHPCPAISECWHIWKFHPSRLAEQIYLPYGIFPGQSEQG